MDMYTPPDFPNLNPSLIKTPPPEPKQATIEDIRPFIEEIADKVWECGLPNSDFGESDTLMEAARYWSHYVRNSLSDCCSSHMMEDLAMMQIRFETVSTECPASGCKETLNHKFLYDVALTIDRVMNRCHAIMSMRYIIETRKN